LCEDSGWDLSVTSHRSKRHPPIARRATCSRLSASKKNGGHTRTLKGKVMERGSKFRLAAALLLTSALSGSAWAQAQQADVLITGGTIYDGSTAKPFTGDVAIAGDKIVYVGPKATVTARRTISAKGMIVSPGLIDPHTHSDHFLDSPDKGERSMAAWTMQGVSSVFVGVDGAGTP